MSSFIIDIEVAHSELDIAQVPSKIRFKELYSWNKGDQFGGVTKNNSYWRARVAEGSSELAFQVGLSHLIEGFGIAKDFLVELFSLGYCLEVVFKFSLESDYGKVLEFSLGRCALYDIANSGVGLRVEAFMTHSRE